MTDTPGPARRPALYYRREEQALELVVRHRDVREVRATGRYLSTDVFVLRLRGDVLKARWTARSQHDTPPYFRGRITAEGDGLRVVGVVRESRMSSFYTALYGSLSVLMGLFAVLTGLDGVWAGLATCGIGAVAFGALWWALRAARRRDFPDDAARLRVGLELYLRTGDAHRGQVADLLQEAVAARLSS